MTYDTSEQSLQDAQPVYLYQLTTGSTVTRLAASPVDIVALGNTWAASPVSHSEVDLTGDPARDSLKLTFPRTDAFALSFLKSASSRRTTVTIYRYLQDSDDYRFYWKGRVTFPQVSGPNLTLNCEPATTSLASAGLSRVFMRQCPHTVYFGDCRVNRSAYAIPAELVSGTGTSITISVSGLLLDGVLDNGLIEVTTTGEMRTILSNIGTSLTLRRPLPALQPSDTLAVFPGCNRTIEVCDEKFDNSGNYGGFPWMLTDGVNPWGGGSLT